MFSRVLLMIRIRTRPESSIDTIKSDALHLHKLMFSNLIVGTTASNWRRPLITGITLWAGIFMILGAAQAQTLQLWLPFDDTGPGTTTTSDPSGALGAGVTLLMETSAGVATNLHGAASSGVQNQGRSIDFTSNPLSGNSAANIAYVTNNAALGSLGLVTNFTVTIWVKLSSNPTNTVNNGPRIFLMGTNGVNDSGQANSIALHYNTQAGSFSNSIVGRVNGSQPSLPIYFPYPTGLWQFFALVYDAGNSNAMIYYGTEGSPAKLLCVNNVGAQTVNFGSSGTLQIGNRITGPRNRAVKGSIDEFRFYTGAGDATFVENIRQASIPVVVSGLYPDGMSLMQGTNTLSFTASSANGINTGNIKVAVNGTDVSSSLLIGGSSTNRTVSYTNLPVDPTLINNANLNAVRIDLQVTDNSGIIASNRVVYDAFSPDHFTWETEDYDFGSGQYIDNPTYAFTSAVDTYWQRAGTPPVDYSDNGNGAPRIYRDPLELVETEFSLGGAVNGGVNVGELMRQKVLNAYALDSSVRDINVGFFDGGTGSGLPNWMNYTRTYPTGLFNLYVRVAFGGGAGASTLAQVTSGWGTPVQTITNLGTFTLNNGGGWQSYQWVPLRNTNGNLVQLSLGGTNTLQSIAGTGGGGNQNFFMLVTANTNLPLISGIFPNGALQPSPTFTFNASSPTGVAINTNSITVLLTAVPLAGNSFVTNLTSANGLLVTGPSTNRNVVYPGLQTNVSYTAVISVTDINGSPAGVTVNFNTFNPILTWEAEDYNYNNGSFVDNPQTNLYAGTFGTAEVDFHDGAGAGGRAYRDIGIAVGPATETATDTPRAAYVGSGLTDYNVGFYDGGDWLNYTRTMPAGQYNIYLRAANGGGGNGALTLARVTSDPTVSPQTTTNLGTFTIPPTGAWQTYVFVPLRDAGGNLVKFTGGSVQTLRGTSSGGLNANFYALFEANTNLPTINNLYPDGATFFQFTNKLTFVASSPAGIATNNIVVTLDGINVSSSLVFGGSPANRTVSYTGLQANTNHTVTISVTDSNSNVGSITVNFDTFKSSYFTWEAEDYDYDTGQFFDNPQVDAYTNLTSTVDVDYHENNAGGTFIYRPTGTATEVTADIARSQFPAGTDFNIGFFGQGEWGNYTRHYPAGTYNVWGRFACGTANLSAALLSVVTDGWGTTSQTTNFLGTFSVPFTSWTSFGWVPMRDGSGNLKTIALNGSTNTLKLTRDPTAPLGDVNVNFLMLVPTASPIAISASLSGTNVNVSFQTQTGLSYQIEWKNDLMDLTWTPLGSPVPGDGSIKSVIDPATGTKRFYRARIQ
jgi:Carbohydrate binding module (family 6)